MIEIDEEKDEIKGFINYMEIDDEIIKNKKEYNNKSIYIINKEKILYGIISEIKEGIYYKSNIDESLIDSPILSLKNNKLIGINKGKKKGKLIINIIKEFNEMNKSIKENLNEITIIYNINFWDDRIILFGRQFVENNKEKCKIIIDNKEQEINEYYFINENEEEKDILKIKLKEIKKITNMSYMFNDCKSLESLPDISKWDTKNATDMSYMFSNCKSLES